LRRPLAFGVCALAALAALVGVLAAGSGGGGAPRSGWSFGAFAGYVWRGPVRSVSASWRVPRVLGGPAPSLAATWVGAQGPAPAGAFIQVGTSQMRVARPGEASPAGSYVAFWSDSERHFHAQALFAVDAGDRVSASVALEHGRWRVTIGDANTHRRRRLLIDEDTDGVFDEAEWTEESPTLESTGRAGPYPEQGTVSIGRLAVNGAAPAYATVASTWMSLGSSELAPGPLAGDAFSLRKASVSAAGARYLHAALAEDAATLPFVALLARLGTSAFAGELGAQSSRFAAVLARNLRVLEAGPWPAAAQPLLRALIARVRALLRSSRAAAMIVPSQLAAWVTRWRREADAVSRAGHLVRRALDVPELTPPAAEAGR
jgi:hypothetical protein